MRLRIGLYVWQQPDKGWSRVWVLPESLVEKGSAWFFFGRYGGGYSPFATSKMGTWEETQRAAEAAQYKFKVPVDVFYGEMPPGYPPSVLVE